MIGVQMLMKIVTTITLLCAACLVGTTDHCQVKVESRDLFDFNIVTLQHQLAAVQSSTAEVEQHSLPPPNPPESSALCDPDSDTPQVVADNQVVLVIDCEPIW